MQYGFKAWIVTTASASGLEKARANPQVEPVD